MSSFKYPKHHKAGDPFPELTAGKMRVYMMQFCPFSQRARLMLEKKNIDYEQINVNLKQKPEWFLNKSKGGTTPVLQIDDKIVPDSLIASEYIDDAYSNSDNVISRDPYTKARHKLLLESHGKLIPHFYKSLKKEEGAWEGYLNALEEFEKLLQNQDYFSGDKVGFVDYMVWPWYERIGSWVGSIPPEKFPKILSWMDKMKADETVAKVATPPEVLKKFIEGPQDERTKYDDLF